MGVCLPGMPDAIQALKQCCSVLLLHRDYLKEAWHEHGRRTARLLIRVAGDPRLPLPVPSASLGALCGASLLAAQPSHRCRSVPSPCSAHQGGKESLSPLPQAGMARHMSLRFHMVEGKQLPTKDMRSSRVCPWTRHTGAQTQLQARHWEACPFPHGALRHGVGEERGIDAYGILPLPLEV